MKFILSMMMLITGQSVFASTEADVKFESKEIALKAAGLDVYESEKNTEAISDASNQIKDIPASIYAGTWIEYNEKNEAVQVIALTSPNGLQKSSKESGVKFIFAKNSTEKLEGLRDKIWELFKGKDIKGESIILGIAIDDQNNQLVVRAREENLQAVKELIDDEIEDSEAIALQKQDGPVSFHGFVRGGTRILSAQRNYQFDTVGYSCTAGFNVTIDGVHTGTITAAHCLHAAPNSLWTSVFFNNSAAVLPVLRGEYIGEYLADAWGSGVDAILFGNVNKAHAMSGTILGNGAIRNVKPLASPVQNTTVCSYGAISKWRCGRQMLVTSQQMINGQIFNFSEADICGAPGDSGGPVVNGNDNALGIYSGVLNTGARDVDGKDTCIRGGAVLGGTISPGLPNSVYQPLGRYLSIYPNVRLMLN